MAHTAVGPLTASSPRRRSRIAKLAAMAVIALVGTALLPPSASMAADAPLLADVEDFAVLGWTTVTNTGPSVINGDLGLYDGTSVTGFEDVDGGPGIVNGFIHITDADAALAQASALAAYNALDAQGCDFIQSTQELGDLVLTPGTYCFSSTALLTGQLTLDAQGDDDAVFIFRVGSSLTTMDNSSVVFQDGLSTCNVFWQVHDAATIGVGTEFIGTVIALNEAITVLTGANITGRVLSLNAAVTLDTNTFDLPVCALAIPPDDTTTTTTVGDTTTTTTVGDTTTTTPVGDTDDTTGDTDDTTGGTDDTTGTTDGSDSTGDVPTVGVPTGGGPAVPGLTSGPGVPANPSRPALPFTGSNLMPAAFAVLAIALGGAIVLVANANRVATARSHNS